MQFKKQIKVGLLQIGERFGEEYYLPYSIGLLQAYAQKNLRNLQDFEFLLPIYKRVKVSKAVNDLLKADIVFFSSYIWNHMINLKIAEGIKQTKPDCIIVFGGPQIPEYIDKLEKLLRTFQFIDIACYGEGELPFLKILENMKEKSWENVPTIGFINQKREFVYNLPTERIKNLDEIPSPFIDDIFNSLMRTHPTEKWSSILETNRGCPFLCSYCYWGREERNKLYKHSEERIFNEIDWISKNKIEFVFCCDANFGILRRDVKIIEKVVKNKEKYGYPKAFSVQNTKNSTEKIFRLQKLLNESGLQKGVNLAQQSLNYSTLKSINRSNISSDVYKELQQLFANDKIPTFSDIIIGLPNESYDTFTAGVSQLIENGQHNRIQFINLLNLENTEMSELEYQRRYGFNITEAEMISHHTSFESEVETKEIQRIVTGTNTMPKEDWIRTKVFCWMTSLLYFDKLLQIPFILINKMCSVNYKELIELFMVEHENENKVAEISSVLKKKALDIQNGGYEYVPSKNWLNIWWPVDEYMFIKLCIEGGLSGFYKDAELILDNFIKKKNLEFPDKLLHDAIQLNMNMIKLPFVETDLDIPVDYDIIEVFKGVLEGENIPIEKSYFKYAIDRTSNKWTTLDAWLKEVVWYGSKKGAYLYNCRLST